jgi:glycosyltransferase involved in cell wall biosynthesis
MDASAPRISAVICTRNRGTSIVKTLESLFASDHPSFEIIVVDQSSTQQPETENACRAFNNDPRFRYFRSETVGSGCSRNIGLSAARAGIVAYTDDDCAVPEDWLEKIELAFGLNPKIAVVFCQVKAANYDRELGFIPEYLRAHDILVCKLSEKNSARGIGAGMAVRRDMVLSIGGFDECLGAGARFPSCEDGDLAVRALIRGCFVYETITTSVIHYGFRTWREGKSLAKRNWIGIGAAYVKPLKQGHWGILDVILNEAFGVIIGGVLKQAVKLHRPRGLRNIFYFVHGMWQGLLTPIDNKSLKFCFPVVARQA